MAGVSLVGVLLWSVPAQGVNSVIVESKTIQGGQSAEIGIFITNDVTVKAIVVPLIVREVDAGSFWTACTLAFNPAGRLPDQTGAPLADIKVRGKYPALDATCKGIENGGFNAAQTAFDFTSPDGLMFSRQKIFGATLAAGTDGAPGAGTPSFTLYMTVNGTNGEFELDSTCVSPANVINFVQDNPTATLKPVFTIGTITIGGNAVHDISTGSAVPERYELMQNHPNPFNAGTVIQFTNRRDGNVKLDVFNILGQHVRTLMDEYRGYGTYAVDWDGKDESGRSVSSGMYFYRLAAGDFTDVKKMVLIK